jgi:hypothetical protein
MVTFVDIANAEKRIERFAGWVSQNPATSSLFFSAPLSIAGVIERGLILQGVCFRRRPDRAVTFEVYATNPPRPKKVPLMRLCWRSSRRGHSNFRRPPGHDLPSRTDPTHIHPFGLNWDTGGERMLKANLPLADNVPCLLETFEEARAYAGEAFKINNIDIVERPEWVYELDL